ncbi:MAG: YtxH domain-containing protein [Lysinibacillus sp.]
MRVQTFFTGLAVGIATGMVAAIMTAPQTGKQLRSNIARNTSVWKEQLVDVKNEANNVKQSITSFSIEAKNNIPQIINELKETITTFKTEIEPDASKLKQEIEILQNSINEIEKNFSQYTNKEQETQHSK